VTVTPGRRITRSRSRASTAHRRTRARTTSPARRRRCESVRRRHQAGGVHLKDAERVELRGRLHDGGAELEGRGEAVRDGLALEHHQGLP
jgi:hypothetical protein